MNTRKILMDAYSAGWITLEALEKIEEMVGRCHEEEFWPRVLAAGYLTPELLERLQNKREQNADAHDDTPAVLSRHDIENILGRFTGVDRIEQIRQQFAQHGRYLILETLGIGGMGIVYKVYDKNLERILALKVPQNISGEHIKLFLRDARSAAHIDHPNIVCIYDVSLQPYPHYTMEYIQGHTLAEMIPARVIGIAEACKMISQVAKGLERVHQKGIIHRDIKPSNIMVDEKDVPKLMDFGLAKVISSDFSITGQMLGTPQYMSPEQIRLGYPDQQSVDAKSDVYSLGATLYELLTGRPPFLGNNTYTVLHEILFGILVEPKSLNPRIPAELNAICLKSLERVKEKRYAKAQDMADDLDNYLNHRPVVARPPTVLERFWKFAVRNKGLVFSTLAIFTALFLGAVAVFIQWLRAETNLENSLHALGKALLEKSRTLYEKRELFAAKMTVARAMGLKKQGKILPTYPCLLKQESRGWEEAYGILADGLDFRLLWQTPVDRHHHEPITCVRFHPQGRLLASVSPHDGYRLWNLATGKLVMENSAQGWELQCFTFSPDGYYCAGCDWRGLVKIWRTSDGHPVQTWAEEQDGRYDIEFTADNRYLVVAMPKGKINRWHIATAREEDPWKQVDTDEIHRIRFSPDGTWFAAACSDKTIRLWNLPASSEKTLPVPDVVYDMVFSEDGRLAAAGNDGIVRVYRVNSGNIEQQFDTQQGPLHNLRFSTEAKQLLVCGEYGVKLWRLSDGKPDKEFQANGALCADVSPDFERMAVGDIYGAVQLWQMESGCRLNEFTGHTGSVSYAAFTPDQNKIVSVGMDRHICLWDISQGRLLRRAGYLGETVATASCPPKYLFAGADARGTITVWNTQSGDIVKQWPNPDIVRALRFSPDGNYLASAGENGVVTIRSWEKGPVVKTRPTGRHPIYALCFTPDGRRLIFPTRTEPEVLALWDFNSDNLKTLQGETVGTVYSLAVRADGKLLASGNQAGMITIWNLESYSKEGSLPQTRGSVFSLDFSPDGRLLAAGGADASIYVWESYQNNLHLLATWSAHESAIHSVRFGADGKSLVSASQDGTVKLWKTATGAQTVFPVTAGTIFDVALHPDGKTFASAEEDAEDRDASVKLWDLDSGTCKASMPGSGRKAYSVRFSNDGKLLAAGRSSLIELWSMQTLKKIATTPGSLFSNAKSIASLDFSPDDGMLAAVSDDGTLAVWDIVAQKPLLCKKYEDELSSVRFRPNGQLLAVAGRDRRIHLWNTQNWQETGTLRGHTYHISSIAFSADGEKLVSGSYDLSVRLWDVNARRCLALLQGHTQPVRAVAFSPDGRMLASGGSDRVIKLWNIETAKALFNLPMLKGRLQSMVFSKDSRSLLSCGSDKRVILWQIPETFVDYGVYTGLYEFDDLDIRERQAMLVTDNLYHAREIALSQLTLVPEMEEK